MAACLFVVLYVALFLGAPAVPEMSAEEMASLYKAHVPAPVIEHVTAVNVAMHDAFERRHEAMTYSIFVFLLPLFAFVSSYLPGLFRAAMPGGGSREVSA
jgi:hypothetical protein